MPENSLGNQLRRICEIHSATPSSYEYFRNELNVCSAQIKSSYDCCAKYQVKCGKFAECHFYWNFTWEKAPLTSSLRLSWHFECLKFVVADVEGGWDDSEWIGIFWGWVEGDFSANDATSENLTPSSFPGFQGIFFFLVVCFAFKRSPLTTISCAKNEIVIPLSRLLVGKRIGFPCRWCGHFPPRTQHSEWIQFWAKEESFGKQWLRQMLYRAKCDAELFYLPMILLAPLARKMMANILSWIPHSIRYSQITNYLLSTIKRDFAERTRWEWWKHALDSCWQSSGKAQSSHHKLKVLYGIKWNTQDSFRAKHFNIIPWFFSPLFTIIFPLFLQFNLFFFIHLSKILFLQYFSDKGRLKEKTFKTLSLV